jgi:hypothetical protein
MPTEIDAQGIVRPCYVVKYPSMLSMSRLSWVGAIISIPVRQEGNPEISCIPIDTIYIYIYFYIFIATGQIFAPACILFTARRAQSYAEIEIAPI